MEFPTLGEHCQYPACNQTDFLPLQCKCGMVFCREHFNSHCFSGDCELAPKPEANLLSNFKIFKCSEKECRKGNLHEMLCGKCDKHYCIEHRFHITCPEIDDETMAAKVEQLEAPKRQFREANKYLQDKITENIRKALQSSAKVKTASKIHLMRIKQKAIGPNIKPLASRVYFAIRKPANMDPKPVTIVQSEENIALIESVNLDPDLKDTIATYVSSQWSLGKAIDCICETCNINNDNNKISTVKLRLFRQVDGYCISPLKLDIEMGELIQKQVLLEGDKLIIEYIDKEILDKLDENDQIFLTTNITHKI